MKKQLYKLSALYMLSTLATANAANSIGTEVTITAVQDVCQSTTGGHATATAFFRKNRMKNVISTNNEFQSVGGTATSQDTALRLDIWKANSNPTLPGTCIGHIVVEIPGGTNQAAQFAIEDYLNTPNAGQGLIVRTGQLDKRSKFDLYVEVKNFGNRRQMVWNNFVGMPNNSGEMSLMRFERGQHFSCANSGETVGTMKFQVFDVDGNFVGVTDGCSTAPKSVHITNDVTTLSYTDLNGNPVDISSAIGRGFIKMTGIDDGNGNVGQFNSGVVIYNTANIKRPALFPYWPHNNFKLGQSSITFARRNASNDSLDLGQ